MANFITDRKNVCSTTNLDVKFYAIISATIIESAIPPRSAA